MISRLSISNVVCWVLTIIFFILGIMNLIQVHPVPGIFYMLISGIFAPPLTTQLKYKTGWVIPFWIKIAIGLIILWGTLAVGDLAEIYGL